MILMVKAASTRSTRSGTSDRLNALTTDVLALTKKRMERSGLPGLFVFGRQKQNEEASNSRRLLSI